MSWTQLNPEDSTNFIKAVADENEPVLFDLALCEVHQLPLDFYEGYHLTRIVNRHMMPYLTMDYLSNGEDHYYMDGTEHGFHTLNAHGALSLNENNVIDYLDFYISYVYERGNSLGFIRAPDSLGAKLLSASDDQYEVEASLDYQGSKIEARITIKQNGSIHIHDPLTVNFLTELTPSAENTYRHPLEEKIITETIALLEQTETGQRLLSKIRETRTDIRVLCSPNYQGFVAHNLTIYMLMPAPEQNAKYLQALVLAYCFRDIEQISAGHGRAPYAGDREEFITSNYVKNLDMIAEMCTIVSEFEALDIPEGIMELEAMALDGVYHAFKAGAEAPELMKIYLTSLEKAGLYD